MEAPRQDIGPGKLLPPRRLMIRELQVPGKQNFWLIKRAFDLCVSLLMLLVLSPLFLLIMLLIVLDDPKAGPFYSQMRCGRGGRVFRMYKFRTMRKDSDKMLEGLLEQNEMRGPAFKIKDDPRVTRFGRLLRKISLDELPQLVNIVRGEMSFVGPRPPLPREMDMYDEYQFQRLYVTPGLTCLWQIAPHRNTLSFDKWLEMDIDYVIRRSVSLDISILMGTVVAVLRRYGE